MIAKIIEALSGFVIGVISSGGYPGIVLLMAIESACIPLPSEVIMPFSGYLVYTGRLSLLWVAFAGALGCNVGSLVAYEIGAYGGRPLVERFGSYILLSRKELDLADHFFERYGSATVLISRMLPVVRTFIALPAGVARMPRLRFHVYTFIGSFPWCLGLAYLGMKAGQNWHYLGKYFHQFDAVIGGVLVLAVVVFVWSRWSHRIRMA
jgi:membrane protein DedA with SNARE-associated domain